jgi:hypothetical protein
MDYPRDLPVKKPVEVTVIPVDACAAEILAIKVGLEGY